MPDEITKLEESFKWLQNNIPHIEFIYVWNVYEQSKPRKLFWRPVGWSLYKEYEKRLKINKQKSKKKGRSTF